MELLLVGLIIALIIVVFWPNLNWWWYTYIVQDFPEDKPPFCFECNKPSCKDCKAHQAYLRSKDEGWAEWYNMKHNQNYKVDK